MSSPIRLRRRGPSQWHRWLAVACRPVLLVCFRLICATPRRDIAVIGLYSICLRPRSPLRCWVYSRKTRSSRSSKVGSRSTLSGIIPVQSSPPRSSAATPQIVPTRVQRFVDSSRRRHRGLSLVLEVAPEALVESAFETEEDRSSLTGPHLGDTLAKFVGCDRLEILDTDVPEFDTVAEAVLREERFGRPSRWLSVVRRTTWSAFPVSST